MMILYPLVMLVVSESLLFFGRVTHEVYLESLPVVVATVLESMSSYCLVALALLERLASVIDEAVQVFQYLHLHRLSSMVRLPVRLRHLALVYELLVVAEVHWPVRPAVPLGTIVHRCQKRSL